MAAENRLRILLHRAPPAFFGGGVLHILRTQEWLHRRGIHAEISYEHRSEVEGFDLVHLLHARQPELLLKQLLAAKKAGKPVVFSPVYWDWQAVDNHLIKLFGRDDGMLSARRREQRLLGILAWEADLVIVGAAAEQQWLVRDFDLPPERFCHVPLAWDSEFASADPGPFVQKTGLRDFVFCVGSICPQENQLALIEAMRGFPAPLLLVSAWNDPAYLEMCRRQAGQNVIFHGPMPLEEISSAYAASKVHVAPSIGDPMNFTTLAAALAGCNLVCEDNPSVREYMGDTVWYCDAQDPSSLRAALQDAFAAPRTGKAREHVAQNFTWQRMAEALEAAYRKAMTMTPGPASKLEQLLEEWTQELSSAHVEQADTERLEAEIQALQRELSAVTSTWGYRLYHAAARSVPYRLLRKLLTGDWR
jgi:glycosyltransferase involved in cell wall biosynthesis